ncbi:MAG TPA: N-acetylglucosamine-6-phosphate deacetylase [Gemmataceae bacterium]|jgi:N-acetylglucosamine-6-phosphate deacetylase|nr:N-acetylglucosamine-6-phosphate deacetylase [Gemmataceae bacterium]
MPDRLFTNGTLIFANRLLDGYVITSGDRILEVGPGPGPRECFPDKLINLNGNYLAPGFIDLHVHGGAGADFMDGTAEAFRTICQAHLRHGTTSLLATSTAARHEQIVEFLQQCRRFQTEDSGGAKVLGAHFYGPYFAEQARGCHPQAPIGPPQKKEVAEFLAFADCIRTATVAPELPGAAEFVAACGAHGIRCNAGHSHATFAQMEEAVRWGVRHVDHLFCAMSDRARLRQTQAYPMRGGVLEATLFFDELTTEVIADGKHLQAELLQLAYKIKGPDHLALVTDCNRALDMPDGEYIFGPFDGGEPIIRRDGVGLLPDGSALASGVMGMDHMVRTFHRLTGAPLVETIRMATLTPARIAGAEREIGSIEIGKRADLLVLDRELTVCTVYRDGEQLFPLSPRFGGRGLG